jgi:DNA-binding LacI/PurR family transcriptional regulator
MATTMTSIAKEAGVSVALVSRLLRNDPTLRITDTRRRQILDIHERVGTVKTRPRRRRLSHTIVVPINRNFSSQYVQASILELEPYRSFALELKKNGFQLYFDFVPHEQMAHTVRLLVQSPASCDGVLILSGICSQEMADDLRASDFPHVSHDHHAERFQINTVHAHVTEGTARTVEYLHSQGHRRIGYLGMHDGYRYSLTVAALATMRLPLDDSLHCWIESPPPVFSPPQLRDFARAPLGRWLDRGRLKDADAPTALVCTNDYAALGAADALRERGLTPGKDLSLAGYDNIEVRGPAPSEHPILTTVDNPMDQIGQRMAELLLNQILHGQTQIVHERLPAPLIVRESTGPCPLAEMSLSMSSNTGDCHEKA